MKKTISGLIALLAVSACAYEPYVSQKELMELALLKLRNNDAELISEIENDEEGFCKFIELAESYNLFSDSDRKLAYNLLRNKLKFSKRDAELIVKHGGFYGTGMTFRGLKCTLRNNIDDINKSFYRYSGHSWQVVTYGGDYIYLDGNGTETGMKITGWN